MWLIILTWQKRMQYMGQTVVLYTRVLRHRKLPLNKSDVTWNINLNTAARSLKGILLLFEDPTDGAMDRLSHAIPSSTTTR